MQRVISLRIEKSSIRPTNAMTICHGYDEAWRSAYVKEIRAIARGREVMDVTDAGDVFIVKVAA